MAYQALKQLDMLPDIKHIICSYCGPRLNWIKYWYNVVMCDITLNSYLINLINTYHIPDKFRGRVYHWFHNLSIGKLYSAHQNKYIRVLDELLKNNISTFDGMFRFTPISRKLCINVIHTRCYYNKSDYVKVGVGQNIYQLQPHQIVK